MSPLVPHCRLRTVEETRRHDQEKLKTVVSQKQHLIDVQDRKIQALDVANTKLLSALSQLKDRRHGPNQNGVSPPASATPSSAQLRPKLALDDEELRQSSC